MKENRGPGRPPKPRAEKQGKMIAVYLTQADAELLIADAKQSGATPSALLAGLWRQWRGKGEA